MVTHDTLFQLRDAIYYAPVYHDEHDVPHRQKAANVGHEYLSVTKERHIGVTYSNPSVSEPDEKSKQKKSRV